MHTQVGLVAWPLEKALLFTAEVLSDLYKIFVEVNGLHGHLVDEHANFSWGLKFLRAWRSSWPEGFRFERVLWAW